MEMGLELALQASEQGNTGLGSLPVKGDQVITTAGEELPAGPGLVVVSFHLESGSRTPENTAINQACSEKGLRRAQGGRGIRGYRSRPGGR